MIIDPIIDYTKYIFCIKTADSDMAGLGREGCYL